MKRILIIVIAVVLSSIIKINASTTINYPNDGGGVFYSALSPYGTWIELDGGVVVWRPMHLDIGWAPYRNGQWIWTSDGWYWDSYDPFGYIVFHYGRWYFDNYYGWIWVPDDVWAPAWVQWRYDNDYIGWSPLPPYASFSIGIGIHFTHDFVTPYRYWHFVRYRYMCDPHVYNYFAPDRDKYRIYSVTKFRTNYGYSNGRVINRGVDVDYVRQRGGSRIVERSIERVDNPRNTGFGRGDVVRAYIPPRDQISRENFRNQDIRRGTRSSSLDISRVEIGKNTGFRRDVNTQRNNDVRNQNNINRPGREAAPRNVRPQPKRTDTPSIRKEPNRNSGYNRPEKNVQKREVRNEVRRENQVRRAPEPRRENQVRRAPEPRRENRSSNNRNDKKESKNVRRR
jgi:Family of unknown function (DUF6600)